MTTTGGVLPAGAPVIRIAPSVVTVGTASPPVADSSLPGTIVKMITAATTIRATAALIVMITVRRRSAARGSITLLLTSI
ncbi:MAG: hypothetical protein QM809_07720 [Gordonia sp. (in: high G+C Gram-positive bacteria)]|uniref:hypothetical protein n=1 Tax=Gordonia sp. (in: high G+C Gram-positive bacteria) TaxID=84139 RepID=UPI0039E5515B